MKNIFKLTLFTLLMVFTLCSNTYCQIFHINEKDNPEILLENFMNARLNGAVRLKDIRYPDVNFDVLKPLGYQRKDHKVIVIEGVGERMILTFAGLKIYYEALNQPEFVLSMIIIEKGGKLVLDDGNILKAEMLFKSHIKDVANINMNFANQKRIRVDVPGDDGVSILMDLEDGIIKRIRCYFTGS